MDGRSSHFHLSITSTINIVRSFLSILTKMATETTPLVGLVPKRDSLSTKQINGNSTPPVKSSLFLFLEAKTPAGLLYEKFTILLIFVSVLTFILSSIFLPQYNTNSTIATKCTYWCDAIFFGNYSNNALEFLGIGATSITEIFIVGVFTIDYILRIYTADLLDDKYKGFVGRVRFIPTFFSLVDLASTVPFYVDSFLLPDTDLAASTFLRMFRLLRMMKVEGRFDLALGMIDDVFYAQRGVLGTALFVGMTVWGVVRRVDDIVVSFVSCVLSTPYYDMLIFISIFNQYFRIPISYLRSSTLQNERTQVSICIYEVIGIIIGNLIIY